MSKGGFPYLAKGEKIAQLKVRRFMEFAPSERFRDASRFSQSLYEIAESF